MPNYFDNPTVGNAQYRGQLIQCAVECGEYSFSGSSTTISVPTYLSSIMVVLLRPQAVTLPNETLFCPGTISGGNVTVSRIANKRAQEFHFPIDDGQLASNNLTTTPLMIAPVAQAIASADGKLRVFCGTAITKSGAGGATFLLNKVGSSGFFLGDGDLTESNGGTSDFDLVVLAAGAIAASDVMTCHTASGNGGTGGDWCVSMQTKIAAAYTSGLKFDYCFIGLR